MSPRHLTVESEQPWATIVPLEGTGDDSIVASEDFSEAVKVGAAPDTRSTAGATAPTSPCVASTPGPAQAFAAGMEGRSTPIGEPSASELTAAVMVAAEDVTVPGEMVREGCPSDRGWLRAMRHAHRRRASHSGRTRPLMWAKSR